MDGLTRVRPLRNEAPHLLILAMTGVNEQSQYDGLPRGAFLSKPFRAPQFIKRQARSSVEERALL